MPAVLIVALVVVPIAELYVIVTVGQAVGVVPTLGLLLLDSLLGAWLLRREGRRTWRAFRTATEAGRVPTREVADGALVIFGGALLLTPGFLSDVLGLLCVLPPSRSVLRRVLLRRVTRRFLAPLLGRPAGLGRRPAGPGGPRQNPQDRQDRQDWQDGHDRHDQDGPGTIDGEVLPDPGQQ